ncbi:MAG: VCBS repeat-containing protein, partial [Akkermansiaceae bacterium]|nr:VCBS repeat-containing protein [Akkermansiaceae bacterium]
MNPGRSVLILGHAASAFLSGPVAAAGISFEDVTEQADLLEPLEGFLGHGAAWGDIDRDGDPDLFVGGFADRPDDDYAPREGPPPNALFENLGNGRFGLIRDSAVSSHARTSGAVFADLDNDGWPELIVGNNAKERGRNDRGAIQAQATTRRTQLFRNASGRFIDISKASGACPERLRSARNVIPFDYDHDGLLDLLVVEDRFTKRPRSALYRNRGGLRFEDITSKAGLPEDLFGLGGAVGRVLPGGGRG